MNFRLNNIFIILLINTLIFIVLSAILPIRFEGNDDVIMAMIANGTISGTPDCHLVFINAIYGSILTGLYYHFPIVEWYTLFFAVFHILSISIITTYILKSSINSLIKAGVVFTIYSLWALMVVCFQWTTTTALVTVAGICMLLKRKFILGGIFITIASLIRFEMAGLIGLIAIPLFINEYRKNLKAWVYSSLIVTIALCLKATDNAFYSSPDWKKYIEYNEIRGKVNDNPNSILLYNNNPPQGLTKNDIKLTLCFFPDPNIVTTEQLLEINKQQKESSIQQKIKHIYNGFIHGHIVHNIIIALLFGILIIDKNKWEKTIFISALLIWFILFCYISINSLVKFRIYIGSLSILLLYITFISKKENWNIKSTLTFLILLVSCLFHSYIAWNTCKAISIGIEKVLPEQLDVIKRADPKYLIDQGNTFSIEYLHPLDMSSDIKKGMFIPSGWMTNYPLIDCRKNNKDIIDNDIWILLDRKESINCLLLSIKEHYNIEPKTEIIEESEHYIIVKLENKES